ncbi:MAG TPA: hypothetical protein VJN91_03980 [Gammaproteobacteria bacterium]|nr:hypothetical protein [Gammaproteobacteria bacterium]
MENIQKQVAELLEKAMAQPGVADLMQLYEAQKSSVDAFAQADQAVAPRWVIYSSTSSSPRTL